MGRPETVTRFAAPRFAALDGMRGLAALLIVVLHLQPMLGTHLFERGYLMVDLFFLMSGFVLSAAYGARLEAGGAGGWFAVRRLVRLWPLAMVGLTLGAVPDLALALHGHHPPHANFALTFAVGAALLPWLAGGLIAPFDGPLWSLQAEFWTNVVYGFVARRLTNRVLIAIIVGCGLALIVSTAVTGSYDGGFANNDTTRHAGPLNFLIAWTRIGFSFPLGLLLHRLWEAGKLPTPSANPPVVLIPVSLGLIAMLPLAVPAAFDLAIVALAFPALLIFAAGCAPVGAMARASDTLGRLSYAIYTIHGPVLVLAHGLQPAGAPLPIRLALYGAAFAVSLTLAAVAERWIDRPARSWAAQRLARPGRAGAISPDVGITAGA